MKESLTKLLSNNGGKTGRVDRLIQKEISARKRAPPSLTVKAWLKRTHKTITALLCAFCKRSVKTDWRCRSAVEW